MKVISGKYKNKAIKTLKSNITRPTVSRIKEDIFNILDNYFIYENKIVFDIFAGSGAIGIEFLSRGVKHCYFNDKNKEAYNIILKNLKLLNDNNYDLYNLDYTIFLGSFKSLYIKADVLIVDPPFKEHNFYYNVFDQIVQFNLLNNYGIIIIESEFEIDFQKYIELDNWIILKYKKYAYRNLYIVRKCNENE